jgi:predicted O-methyltransferase YrrM
MKLFIGKNGNQAMTTYNDVLSKYINDLFVIQDEGLQWTYQDTPQRGLPAISVKPEEGRFLQFLVRACGVRKAVEIGTLGGYSGIWIARGLAKDGKLITLEKEAFHAKVAREHFEAAGVAERIEIRIGNAHETLDALKQEGPFDFVFIDAEKPGYEAYYDWAIENLRPGGVIAAHNAFRKGSVAGTVEDDDYSAGMRAFNQRVAKDQRVISTIFPAGDGILVAVKTD